MKRRHFLTKSLAAGSLACAANTDPLRGQSPQQNHPAPVEGRARFEELNQALDREAMQRGWATQVDAGYRYAPQSAIEDFKDRKFGIGPSSLSTFDNTESCRTS